MTTLWFRSYRDACKYCTNAGIDAKPVKRLAWVDYGWRRIWSLQVPDAES